MEGLSTPLYCDIEQRSRTPTRIPTFALCGFGPVASPIEPLPKNDQMSSPTTTVRYADDPEASGSQRCDDFQQQSRPKFDLTSRRGTEGDIRSAFQHLRDLFGESMYYTLSRSSSAPFTSSMRATEYFISPDEISTSLPFGPELFSKDMLVENVYNERFQLMAGPKNFLLHDVVPSDSSHNSNSNLTPSGPSGILETGPIGDYRSGLSPSPFHAVESSLTDHFDYGVDGENTYPVRTQLLCSRSRSFSPPHSCEPLGQFSEQFPYTNQRDLSLTDVAFNAPGYLQNVNDNMEAQLHSVSSTWPLAAVAEDPCQNPPPTDSGYESFRHRDSFLNYHPWGITGGSSTPSRTIRKDFDAKTSYSAASTVGRGPADQYVAELASDIRQQLFHRSDIKAWQSVQSILPELIKAFAIQVGLDSTSQNHKSIMYFIHKRGRQIGSRLVSMSDELIIDASRESVAGMSVEDKISLWNSKVGVSCPSPPQQDRFQGIEDTEEDALGPVPISEYRDIVLKGNPFKCLVARLNNEMILQWDQDNSKNNNVRKEIRQKILECLPTGRISKKHSPKIHQVRFRLLGWPFTPASVWHPANYEAEVLAPQSISESLIVAYCTEESQATTITNYLEQVWPSSWNSLYDVLQIHPVINGSGDYVSDKTHTVAVQDDPSTFLGARLEGKDLVITVKGSSYLIAEYGEQLAWLSAAIPRPLDGNVSNRTPCIHHESADEARYHDPGTDVYDASKGIHLWQDASSGRNPSCSSVGDLKKDEEENLGWELSFMVGRHILDFVDRTAIIPGLCLQDDESRLTPSSGDLLASWAPKARGRVFARCNQRLRTTRRTSHPTSTGHEDTPSLSNLTPEECRRDSASRHDDLADESDSLSYDSDFLSMSEVSDEVNITPLSKDDPLYIVLKNVGDTLFNECQPQTRGGTAGSADGPASAFLSASTRIQGPPSSSGQQFGREKRKAEDQPGSEQVVAKRQRQERKHEVLLACPFWKSDPISYHECSRRKLKRVRDVKQHLNRCHTPKHYCQRCLRLFTNDNALREHVSAEGGWTCSRSDSDTLNGISHEQSRRLHQRSTPSTSDECQWFAMWEIIFPGKHRPRSAYMDHEISEDLAAFQEHLDSRAGPALHEALESRGFIPGLTTEEERQLVQGVISDVLYRLRQDWTSSRSVIPQAPHSAPSLPQTPYSNIHASSLGTPAAASSVDSAIVLGSYNSSANPATAHTFGPLLSNLLASRGVLSPPTSAPPATTGTGTRVGSRLELTGLNTTSLGELPVDSFGWDGTAEMFDAGLMGDFTFSVPQDNMNLGAVDIPSCFSMGVGAEDQITLPRMEGNAEDI
ncbi:hypothetical protein CTAM01_13786 [Colletotrichum tamarilloi]|uniref:C2H2-type domain-containing protein n=1 Tax=Colletotrichum tamarilloi TaxID=1209934 RepID=A0ABQ9QR32_9PEZI|nr:uncharacterized protein CTAM01_13786 [Colletotrichum tamarilloi]KAK1481851.1 hypothetical protein CTAM01_13786 [Colletotrichum tamarilloi]